MDNLLTGSKSSDSVAIVIKLFDNIDALDKKTRMFVLPYLLGLIKAFPQKRTLLCWSEIHSSSYFQDQYRLKMVLSVFPGMNI
jgi:hypothetical protein